LVFLLQHFLKKKGRDSMMKFLRQLIALSVFTLGFGVAGSVLAAGTPDPKSLEAMNVCTACHSENWNKPILSLFQTKHGVKGDPRTPGCQSCHGMSAKHLESPTNSPDVKYTKGSTNTPEERTEKCLACHSGGMRAWWEGSQHQTRGVVCANCHDIHRPQQRVLNKATQPEVCYNCHKTQRAEFNKLSHMPVPEGKMACSDCHNPHGSTGPKLLVKNSVNETCFTCHAEKRGPFLWEHAPATEDCTNCHLPHGSNNAPLLKMRPPYLCQSCHTGDHASALKSGTTLLNGAATTANGTQAPGAIATQVQTGGRACLNCHVMIHGSNSTGPGAKFHR